MGPEGILEINFMRNIKIEILYPSSKKWEQKLKNPNNMQLINTTAIKENETNFSRIVVLREYLASMTIS